MAIRAIVNSGSQSGRGIVCKTDDIVRGSALTRQAWLAARLPASAVGIACGAGAALFWAAGFAAARHGVTIGYSPADLALHRFAWAGLVFLPLMMRQTPSDVAGIGWTQKRRADAARRPAARHHQLCGLSVGAARARRRSSSRRARPCSASCFPASSSRNGCRPGASLGAVRHHCRGLRHRHRGARHHRPARHSRRSRLRLPPACVSPASPCCCGCGTFRR